MSLTQKGGDGLDPRARWRFSSLMSFHGHGLCALLILGSSCAHPSSPSPMAAAIDPAIAFASGLVAALGRPDDALTDRLDLEPHLLSATCLSYPEGSDWWFCADWAYRDKVFGDPAAMAAERKKLVSIMREAFQGPPCVATGELLPVERDARAVGSCNFRTGESNATTEQREGYRRFIASVDREVIVVFRCGAERKGVWVVRRKAESALHASGGGTLEH